MMYIRHQPAFHLSERFTLDDLIYEYHRAKSMGADCVYVPVGNSKAHLDLWYVEALISHLSKP